MQIFVAIVSVVALLLGAYVAVFNCGAIIASLRLKRRGFARHISTIPLLAQVFTFFAAMLSGHTTALDIPSWVFWLVVLVDPALWQLLYLPILALLKKLRTLT